MKFYYPMASELGSSLEMALELERAGQLRASSLKIILKGGKKLCGKLLGSPPPFPVRPWS